MHQVMLKVDMSDSALLALFGLFCRQRLQDLCSKFRPFLNMHYVICWCEYQRFFKKNYRVPSEFTPALSIPLLNRARDHRPRMLSFQSAIHSLPVVIKVLQISFESLRQRGSTDLHERKIDPTQTRNRGECVDLLSWCCVRGDLLNGIHRT
jgi:hypothetical protein